MPRLAIHPAPERGAAPPAAPPAAPSRRLEVRIDVAASPDRVWEVMRDVGRWHEWTPSITAVTLIGGGPLALGTRAVTRQPGLPPALWKVTALEPGRSFTWTSVAPGLRVVARHAVHPAAGGSRATLSIDFHGLLGGLWARATHGITARYLDLEARGLKARSEDPGFRQGAGAR